MSQESAARATSGLVYASKVARVRESLTTDELASIVGVQPRAVQHWAAETNKPTGVARDKLLEVAYVVDLLREVYDAEGVEIWLHGRNRLLGDRRPLDLLLSGEFDQILRAVERLTSGAM